MSIHTLRHAAALLAAALALTNLTPAAHAQAPFPPDDCGDTRETARPISPGQTLQGRFDAKGFLVPDIDVYRVEAPIGRLIKFTLDFIDPRDFLFDDPSRFNTNYDNTSPIGSTIVRPVNATNEFAVTESPFYVNVIHPSRPDGTPVRYTLACTDIGPVPPPLATNTPDNPELLQPNVWYTVPTTGRGSPWWVGIPVLAGQAVAFDRETSEGRVSAPSYLTGLVFAKPTRASDEFFFLGQSSTSSLLPGDVAPADGVVAVPTSGQSGERLRFRIITPPRDPDENSFVNPTPLTFSSAAVPFAQIRETFQNPFDVDVFTMYLTQGQRLRVSANDENTQGRTIHRLVDPDGVTLERTRTQPPGFSQQSIPIERSGLHRLFVQYSDFSRPVPAEYAIGLVILPPIPGADPRGFVPMNIGGGWIDSAPLETWTTQTFGVIATQPQSLRVSVESDAQVWPIVGVRVDIDRPFPIPPQQPGVRTASTVVYVNQGGLVRLDITPRDGTAGFVRVRVDRFLAEADDFADSPAAAPILPIGQVFPTRGSRPADVDAARFQLQPGRLYGSFTQLTFFGEVSARGFKTFEQPSWRYIVDRPTIVGTSVLGIDGFLGVLDLGPAPTTLAPLTQQLEAGQPLTISTEQSAGYSIPAPALLTRVYRLSTTPSTYGTTIQIRAGSPWPDGYVSDLWFNTPTSWGATELRAAIASNESAQPRTHMLDEVANPSRLMPGSERSLDVGQTDWIYTDGSDTPGLWVAQLPAGRLYQLLLAYAPGIFTREVSRPSADYTADKYTAEIINTVAAHQSRTIRIAGPQPGSAASARIIDLGPLPTDDVVTQADAQPLRIGQVTTGTIDYIGDKDWFTLSTDRVRRVRVDLTSSSTLPLIVQAGRNVSEFNWTNIARLSPGEATRVQVSIYPRILLGPSPLLPAPIPYSITVTPVCDADIAGANQSLTPDGQLTADDFIVFLNAYLTGQPRGDIAGFNQDPYPDNQFTADDLIAYINAFFAGC